MQEAVTAAEDLPHSAVGGPWALDGPNNYGSYLFDFGSLTEKTVDSWIALAEELGVTQIDFPAAVRSASATSAPPRISIPTAWRA